MSRQSQKKFHCQPLEELGRELLFSPQHKRAEQVLRAERLHDELDPAHLYPLDFLVFRITGRRVKPENPPLLVGQAIGPDLRLIIDLLSHSIEKMPGDEPLQTTEELAARLGVATKTIARWRDLGLRWRWSYQRKKKTLNDWRIVFTRSAVDHFLSQQPEHLPRVNSIKRLDPKIREKLLQRARRITQSYDVSLNRLARHLSKKCGKSLQTIREMLSRHDRENPKSPLFSDRTGPLTNQQRHELALLMTAGASMQQMTKKFRRTRSTIYRALHLVRAAEIRKAKWTWMHSPLFDRPDADAVLLTEPAKINSTKSPSANTLKNLPPELRTVFATPAIPASLQLHWLVRYNYHKFKADQIRKKLHRYEPRVGDLDLIDMHLRQARLLREKIVAGSLSVVWTVIRKHINSQSRAADADLFSLLPTGLSVLLEAVETHDISHARPFENYLTWLLMRQFASQNFSSHVGDVSTAPASKARRKPDAHSVRDELVRIAAAAGVRLPE